jgi:hypothetical protein
VSIELFLYEVAHRSCCVLAGVYASRGDVSLGERCIPVEDHTSSRASSTEASSDDDTDSANESFRHPNQCSSSPYVPSGAYFSCTIGRKLTTVVADIPSAVPYRYSGVSSPSMPHFQHTFASPFPLPHLQAGLPREWSSRHQQPGPWAFGGRTHPDMRAPADGVFPICLESSRMDLTPALFSSPVKVPLCTLCTARPLAARYLHILLPQTLSI